MKAKGEAAAKYGESAKERASIVKMATDFAGKVKNAGGEAAEAAVKPLKIKSAKGEGK